MYFFLRLCFYFSSKYFIHPRRFFLATNISPKFYILTPTLCFVISTPNQEINDTKTSQEGSTQAEGENKKEEIYTAEGKEIEENEKEEKIKEMEKEVEKQIV